VCIPIRYCSGAVVLFPNSGVFATDSPLTSRLWSCLVWLSLLLEHLCVIGLHGAIYIFKNFASIYLLASWVWWDWPSMWLTNHHPSLLWHCCLGHITRKIVSKMTYNVSTGMLNTIIPMLIPHFATDIIHDAAMMRSLNMYCGPDGDLTSSKILRFPFLEGTTSAVRG